MQEFWEKHARAETPLRAWYQVANQARWQSFEDIRQVYRTADRVGDTVIFNIGGNEYRLLVKVEFRYGKLYIRDVLTHADYSKNLWKDKSYAHGNS